MTWLADAIVNAVTDAVARGDDDGILVDIYDNVQDELRAMKKRYENEKKKVKLLLCTIMIMHFSVYYIFLVMK